MTVAVALANQKGGVGKTTTAVTLGHGLAAKGLRVLVVDLDPQGHVAESLGLGKAPGLYNLLVVDQPLGRVVVHARANLDVVPGDKRTEAAKRHLTAMDFREKALAVALKGAPYDVILFDCAPSFDVLHVTALVASDFLLIPTRLDYLAADGVNEVLRSTGEVMAAGYPIGLLGILPTFFDRVTRETTSQLRGLVDLFGAKVWPPIPQDTRAREAPAFGQTLWEYAPWSPAMVGYENGDHRIGGYQTALRLFLEALHGEEDSAGDASTRGDRPRHGVAARHAGEA